ncbi:MAG: membrane protein insertion efficiency factor YidD [Candidatus Omnitrophica bacterium]|nr:membrane protein insertion efficiency factor YidD [Candidatus Omnitrophota bacterium]
MKKILLRVVRFYQQAISPYLGQHCRFFPRCSEYAHTAMEEKGMIQGGLLILKRLSRCHPFHSGGVDFVE